MCKKGGTLNYQCFFSFCCYSARQRADKPDQYTSLHRSICCYEWKTIQKKTTKLDTPLIPTTKTSTNSDTPQMPTTSETPTNFHRPLIPTAVPISCQSTLSVVIYTNTHRLAQLWFTHYLLMFFGWKEKNIKTSKRAIRLIKIEIFVAVCVTAET